MQNEDICPPIKKSMSQYLRNEAKCEVLLLLDATQKYVNESCGMYLKMYLLSVGKYQAESWKFANLKCLTIAGFFFDALF